MAKKQGTSKNTPYHPEELRWEESACNPSSMHNEDNVDPLLEQNTEGRVETEKSNFDFEQVQKSSPSDIEDKSFEAASDKEEIPEKLPEKDTSFSFKTASDEMEIPEKLPEKDGDLSFDVFPSDEFPTEENFASYDLNNENLDVLENLELPDFDQNAQEFPWDITSPETDPDFRANRKASIISDMLILKNPAEENRAIKYLTDIFLMHPHSATFRAFENMVREGLSFTDLKTIIDLRHIWMERSDWWLYRNKKREVKSMQQGHIALTWKLAQRICQARWEFPPDAMIEESWLEEWLCLHRETAGYKSFPFFIEEKIKHKDAIFLHDGLQVQAIFNREVESIDAPTWRKQYPDYQDTCHDNYAVKRTHQPPSENTGE